MNNVYEYALQSLDASNLIGLARSLHEEVIPAVQEDIAAGNAPCDQVSDHPAVILMLDQMNELRGGDLKFDWAYEAAQKKTKQAHEPITHHNDADFTSSV